MGLPQGRSLALGRVVSRITQTCTPRDRLVPTWETVPRPKTKTCNHLIPLKLDEYKDYFPSLPKHVYFR